MEAAANARSDRSRAGRQVPRRAAPRRQRLLPTWLFSGLFSATGVALLMLLFGAVQGQEFSPQLFQSRMLRYYQLPWVRWRLTPIRRVDSTTPLESLIAELVAAGPPARLADEPQAWSPGAVVSELEARPAGAANEAAGEHEAAAPASPVRWDVVWLAQPSAETWYGDAKILLDCLELRDGEPYFWAQWHQQHPERAALLWPRVAALARARLYVAIPDLLHVAADLRGPIPLESALNEVLVSQALELGERAMEAAQPDLAAAAFQLVLQYQPQCPSAERGLQDALRLLRKV